MGVAIKCLLEREIPGAPHMEGKSLLAAYLGELAEVDADDEPIHETATSDDIIHVNFGGPASDKRQSDEESETNLGPLQPFMSTPDDMRWHNPKDGLAAVRGILSNVRDDEVRFSAPKDFMPGFENEEELTEGVIYDLETLEEILVLASKNRIRFALSFS